MGKKKIEQIFSCYDDDMGIVKFNRKYGERYETFQVYIEGYIIFESLKEAMDYYGLFRDSLAKYFIEKIINIPERDYPLYKSVDIEIAKWNKQIPDFCIYVNAPKVGNIHECYWWLEDLISQLEYVDKNNLMKND